MEVKEELMSPPCGHLRFQQPVKMSKPEPDVRIKTEPGTSKMEPITVKTEPKPTPPPSPKPWRVEYWFPKSTAAPTIGSGPGGAPRPWQSALEAGIIPIDNDDDKMR
jgi:hypothetical protein